MRALSLPEVSAQRRLHSRPDGPRTRTCGCLGCPCCCCIGALSDMLSRSVRQPQCPFGQCSQITAFLSSCDCASVRSTTSHASRSDSSKTLWRTPVLQIPLFMLTAMVTGTRTTTTLTSECVPRKRSNPALRTGVVEPQLIKV